jgi:NAD(P)-dependent dehydrogenase (short-subunit alcohol dehydrogenase family)
MNNAFGKFDLSGRTALVTGGGTGLGYFMSRGLARSGAKVLIAARRAQVLKLAADRLTEESDHEVLWHTVDLADPSSREALVVHARHVLGGVDILVANAAHALMAPVEQIDQESLDAMVAVNISANLHLLRAFLPGMRARKWGRVLFSSSATSVQASPHEGIGMYTVVKGAMNAFTRTAAAECGHDGITVNSLILGMYLTDLAQELAASLDAQHGAGAGKAFLDSYGCMTALGRLGQCEEVEGVVQLLASDAGAYITGTNLAIDGGMTAMIRPNAVPA